MKKISKEEFNQFMESLGTLKQISSPDEGFREIVDIITKYRSAYCESLKKRIRDTIEYLCKYVAGKEVNFCDDDIYKIISTMCKYYEIYRKYCCFACCIPKIPEWDLIIMNLNTINHYLTPGTVTQNFGLNLPDLELDKIIPEFQLKICEILKNTLKQLIYIICKYHEQNLCGDNELTRSIIKLCKLYPYFRGKCCNKEKI